MNKTRKELYKRIYAELFEILNTLKDEEIEKIPKRVKLNIIDNMNPSCEFKYDHSKKLQDQDVLPQTKALLIEIYLKYLADSEEEVEAWQIYKENFLREMNGKRKEDYDSQKIFNKHIERGVPVIEDYEEIEVSVNKKKDSFIDRIKKKR